MDSLGGMAVLLFFIFLILKLTEAITWAWIWVFAPLWGVPVLLLGGVLFMAIISGILHLLGRE